MTSPAFAESNVVGLYAASMPDSLEEWIRRYLALAVAGVRSPAVEQKTTLHLRRFAEFQAEAYGHDQRCGASPRLQSWVKPRSGRRPDPCHTPMPYW